MLSEKQCCLISWSSFLASNSNWFKSYGGWNFDYSKLFAVVESLLEITFDSIFDLDYFSWSLTLIDAQKVSCV